MSKDKEEDTNKPLSLKIGTRTAEEKTITYAIECSEHQEESNE